MVIDHEIIILGNNGPMTTHRVQHRPADAMSEPQRRTGQHPNHQEAVYPGFRNFFSSINNLFTSLSTVQFLIPTYDSDNQRGGNSDGPIPCPPHVVNTIPRRQYNQELGKKMIDEECAICKEEFKTDEPLMFLGCKHGFHEACMLPWLRQVI